MRPAFLFAGCLALCAAARADVYLIANPSLQITPDEAVETFTGDKQMSGAVKLVPMDNAAAQGEFLAKALHMTADKYTALWTKKAFRDGLNAPSVRANDLEVLRIVRSTPGSLGYVSAPAQGVNVIRKY